MNFLNQTAHIENLSKYYLKQPTFDNPYRLGSNVTNVSRNNTTIPQHSIFPPQVYFPFFDQSRKPMQIKPLNPMNIIPTSQYKRKYDNFNPQPKITYNKRRKVNLDPTTKKKRKTEQKKKEFGTQVTPRSIELTYRREQGGDMLTRSQRRRINGKIKALENGDNVEDEGPKFYSVGIQTRKVRIIDDIQNLISPNPTEIQRVEQIIVEKMPKIVPKKIVKKRRRKSNVDEDYVDKSDDDLKDDFDCYIVESRKKIKKGSSLTGRKAEEEKVPKKRIDRTTFHSLRIDRPKYKKKYWSKSEEENLKKGMRVYGNDWNKILSSYKFQKRTIRSLQAKAEKSFSKLLSKIKKKKKKSTRSYSYTPPIVSVRKPGIPKKPHWTEQEKRNLKKGMKKFGRNWEKILKHYKFKDRTVRSLQAKSTRVE